MMHCQSTKISFEGDEIDFADAEEDELETGDDDENLDESSSLTSQQIYDEVKDRMFERYVCSFPALMKNTAFRVRDCLI